MQRVDFLKAHGDKVKYIYDFLNHKHSPILYIKGMSKEGKKTTTEEAVNLAREEQLIQDIGYSENSWTFININTAQVKIIHHIYSWDDLPRDSNVPCVAFDRDPRYSSSLLSSSSNTS
jgi:hypothetical protein